MPIFRFRSVNLKFTPAKKNLHEYTRGSCDKYQVWQGECIIPDLWEYYCRTAGPSYNISQLKIFM